jgi:Rieske Fe-S protein
VFKLKEIHNNIFLSQSIYYRRLSMEDLNRRQFLKKSTLSVVVTSTCLCGLNGCATFTKVGNTPSVNPDSFKIKDGVLIIDLSKDDNLSKIGGCVKIINSNIPDSLIIARVEDKRFEIASLLCTHRGVELEYNHSQSNFKCASLGGSTFTFNGEKLSGPAEKPIKIYTAILKNNILNIKIDS